MLWILWITLSVIRWTIVDRLSLVFGKSVNCKLIEIEKYYRNNGDKEQMCKIKYLLLIIIRYAFKHPVS